MTRAVGVTVGGQVQGVFFRAELRRQASRLGVTGWVRNASDGTVVAHLEGDPDAVDELLRWCHAGPPQARVDRVDVRDADATGAAGFSVRG